jgi:hypothetical protein
LPARATLAATATTGAEVYALLLRRRCSYRCQPPLQTDLPMPKGCSGRLLIRQAARPQWGSGRAAWREPGASDLRAFQAPLVRTGGLPSRIR